MLEGHPHVEEKPGHTLAYVAGTKVPVVRLFEWHRKGVPFETLVKRYPSLTPAQILSALSFGYDKPGRMQRDREYLQRLFDEGPFRIPGEMKQTKLPFDPSRHG